MPERPRQWVTPLSDVDRVAVRLTTDGPLVLEFSVQYEALIAGHWRRIVRYDNAHGSGAHRHVYYPNKRELRQIVHPQDDNQGLTEAQMIVKQNFKKFRENYIMVLENVGGGDV